MHKIEMTPQWPAPGYEKFSHAKRFSWRPFYHFTIFPFFARFVENTDGKRLQRLGERGGYNKYNKKINLDQQQLQQQQQQAYKDSSNNNIMMNSGNVMGNNNNDFNTIMNVSCTLINMFKFC